MTNVQYAIAGGALQHPQPLYAQHPSRAIAYVLLRMLEFDRLNRRNGSTKMCRIGSMSE